MVKNKKNKVFTYIAAAAAIYFLYKKMKAPSTPGSSSSGSSSSGSSSSGSSRPLSDQIIVDALRKIYQQYGREKTAKLEQLYRKETAHFTSGQFKGTYSPGMEPSPQSNTVFPFGWSSLRNFATAKGYQPFQFYLSVPYTEGGTGIRKKFIAFPDLYSAMLFVMYVIEKRNWNFGKWRAFDETISSNYNASLNNIIPRITNTF